MMRTMVLMVLLAAGCSAETPLHSTNAAMDDAECINHDSPPMGDDICLSNEQFDTLADFECPTIEATSCPAVECPAVEVVCADAPVTVACECPAAEPVACPSVEVTCETPEPEACEPEIVEVAVQPPSFRVIGLPIAGDPSEMPAVILLGVEFFGGDVDVRMTTLTFSTWKYGSVEWYPRGYFEGTDFCALVDCATLQLWQYREDDDSWELLSGTLQSITSIAVGTPEDWEGHLLPAHEQQRVLLLGNVRADVPPGRYHIALNDFLVAGEDGEVIIPGTPAHGSDFTVAEDVPESDNAVPPKFINVSNPVPLNPRGSQRVLEFRRCAGSQPLTMVEIQFVLGEYIEGTEGSAWRTRSPCEVLDCGTVSVAWNVEDGSGDTTVTPLATRTEASVTLATPFEWESTVIPAERCAYFSVETETRTDAPTGRYTISTQYFAERIGGDEDVSLTAPLLRGSEIIIAEDETETDAEALPRMTFLPGGHIVGDPADADSAFSFGRLLLFPYVGEWYVLPFGLYLKEVVDTGGVYASIERPNICEVLDCNSAELVWVNPNKDAAWNDTTDDTAIALINFFVSAIPDALFVDWDAWEGFRFPTEPETYEILEVRGKFRSDARPGRYYLEVNPNIVKPVPAGGMLVKTVLPGGNAGVNPTFVVGE